MTEGSRAFRISLEDHHLINILNQVFNFSNYRQISSNSGKIFRENFQICRSISKLLLSSDQNVRVNTSGYRCLFFTIVRGTYNGVLYVVTWNISENLIGAGKNFNLPLIEHRSYLWYLLITKYQKSIRKYQKVSEMLPMIFSQKQCDNSVQISKAIPKIRKLLII